MSYTAPTGNSVTFNFTEAGYTAPAGGSIAFSFNVPVAVSRGLGIVIGKIKGIFFDKEIHL